jgi:Na+-driven multidrug efflux pump
MKAKAKSQYLWGLFFLGLFLLNYPLLSLYNIPEKWMGMPVLFLFFFAFWALIIVLTYWVIKKTDSKNNAE